MQSYVIFWTNLDPSCVMERRGGEKKLGLVRAAKRNEEDNEEKYFFGIYKALRGSCMGRFTPRVLFLF